MSENKNEHILVLLKKSFPEFEKKLDGIYRQDSLFREIAEEYYEIVKRMEMKYLETSKKLGFYTDTMNELREELADYLNNLKANNYIIND